MSTIEANGLANIDSKFLDQLTAGGTAFSLPLFSTCQERDNMLPPNPPLPCPGKRCLAALCWEHRETHYDSPPAAHCFFELILLVLHLLAQCH